jgi:hypothetical protein
MAKININMNSLKEKKEWKRHAVNQGDNIYRVLPPFGVSADGYPYRRWVLIWLSDPQTSRLRPYSSPFSFGQKQCPVYEYVNQVEQLFKEEEARLLSSGEFSRDQIKEHLRPITDVLWKIKPTTTYLYNACNKSGEVGLLELKKTAHDAIKKQMMQYVTDYGQDPTSLNSDFEDSGVWFKITRTGEKTKTEYSVSKNQVKTRDPNTGKISWADDQEPLPDNVVENYQDLGYDLTTVYKQVSYDELKEVLLANLEPLMHEYPILRVEGFYLPDGEDRSRSDVVVEEEQEDEGSLHEGTLHSNIRTVRSQAHDVGNNFRKTEDKSTKHSQVYGSGVPGRQAVRVDLPAKKTMVKIQEMDEFEDEKVLSTPIEKPRPKITTKLSAQDDVFDYADSILNS